MNRMVWKPIGCDNDAHERAYKICHKDDHVRNTHTVFMECEDCGAEWQVVLNLSEMRGRHTWTNYNYKEE